MYVRARWAVSAQGWTFFELRFWSTKHSKFLANVIHFNSYDFWIWYTVYIIHRRFLSRCALGLWFSRNVGAWEHINDFECVEVYKWGNIVIKKCLNWYVLMMTIGNGFHQEWAKYVLIWHMAGNMIPDHFSSWFRFF